MNSLLVDRIDERLRDLGISDRSASMKATGTADTIRNIKRGRDPRAGTLGKLARALRTSTAYLVGETSNPAPVSERERGQETATRGQSTDFRLSEDRQRGYAQHAIRYPAPAHGPRNLPVLGRALGAGRKLILDYQEPVEFVPRPASLETVPDAFAVRMHGESMGYECPHGSLCYVNPHEPPRSNDLVLIETTEGEALIKRLLRMDEQEITVRQANPEHSWQIAREDVQNLYRVRTIDLP